MKINSTLLVNQKSPVISGLFFLLLTLAACNAAQTPAQVTNEFWSALAQNDIATAQRYALVNSTYLAADIHGLDLQNTTMQYGEIRINGPQASVDTVIIYQANASQKPDLHFKTYLLQENNLWKIDFQQTLINIPGKALSDLFNNLQLLGKNFSRQLQQQLPIIEEQIEEFSKQLNEQIEEFNLELEKSMPKDRADPNSSTI